jgi:hypothetical protein
MLMAFSSVNMWRVFLAKSCPQGSVTLRNISVHGPATMQCCQRKHRASCTLHRIYFNNVTGVKTWGTLTTFQTWCPSPLPLTISQVPCRIQSFLQELWHQPSVPSSYMQWDVFIASSTVTILSPAYPWHYLSCMFWNYYLPLYPILIFMQ